jgi:hypothetical protein
MPAAKKEKFLEGMTKCRPSWMPAWRPSRPVTEKAREHLAKVNDLKKEYHNYAKQKG